MMSVPKPKANESERDFISRCEKFMHEEKTTANLKLRNVPMNRSQLLLFNLAQKQNLNRLLLGNVNLLILIKI